MVRPDNRSQLLALVLSSARCLWLPGSRPPCLPAFLPSTSFARWHDWSS